MDKIDKLYGVCDALNNKFSGNENPYMTLSRLLEESGELASAVHHIRKNVVGKLKSMVNPIKKI